MEVEIENVTDCVDNITDYIESTTDCVDNTTDYIENTTDRVDNTTDHIENTIHYVENTTHCTENGVKDDFSTIHLFSEETTFFELSRSSWHPAYRNLNRQTYLRGCKWSPDGTCCLTIVNNDGVHLIELPKNLYEGESLDSDRPIDILESVVHIPESGTIYDFCWYPGMNSLVPESCCWITTGQNKPIQMWDAFDGALRCSYRGYNAVDEVEPAISICFSKDALQIHAGYKKSIKTFDIERPGRECVHQKIAGSAASLAVSPHHDIIAVGSWKTDISLYSMQEGSAKSLGKLRGHSGGITNLQFSPDGSKLVSGARKDNQINIWDIKFYKRPLKTLQRKVETNQRVYFDISKCGKYILSGGTDGILRAWNISDVCNEETVPEEYLYPVHKDCCNGISIHPYRPILATCSGQHHFSDDIWSDSYYEGTDVKMEEEDSSVNISGSVNDRQELKKDMEENKENNNKQIIENTLEFWWVGSISKMNDVNLEK